MHPLRLSSAGLLEHAQKVPSEDFRRVLVAKTSPSERLWERTEVVHHFQTLRVNCVDRVLAHDRRIASPKKSLEPDRRLTLEKIGADTYVIYSEPIGHIDDVIDDVVERRPSITAFLAERRIGCNSNYTPFGKCAQHIIGRISRMFRQHPDIAVTDDEP
jgi:hypothetical protein